ncbi:hypothetical protein RBH29_04975 [Herbivorax sp. ANBcel31]|uniref:hypothetical protein n=1 Tax=Herbivorax sp. ANBcel31 TaxID=3069754 RepID=UPI0027AF87B1|nr:hypothetical protein [Herbivorax sp. ANBcel31]MDQ2085787.1 hypothetical protein [Herbivorax sp. ANBcel31]
MKIIAFRLGKKKMKYRNKITINILEKVFFFIFVCVFLSLIFIQSAMMNPNIRSVLVNENGLEGNPLQLEEYLYKKGELFISLKSEKTNEKVKVLLNGDEIATFTANIVKLYVKDGDVVEIDSTMADNAKVEIISTSNNIADNYKGTKINLNSEIKQLTKIRID